MTDVPEGWTDDLTVALPPGRTVTEVVDFVLGLVRDRAADGEIEAALETEFSISSDDADLVRDRVCGGVVRAATRNLANRPSPEKDPFAWTAFGRAMDDPSIIATMYPEFTPAPQRPKRWWHHLRKR